MMYTPIQEKLVKTRVEHRCEWCDEDVDKGTTAFYRAYVWEGDFNSGYMHEECRAALLKAPADLIEEGWTPGEFKKGTHELTEAYA